MANGHLSTSYYGDVPQERETPYGKNGTGQILYHSSGYMAVAAQSNDLEHRPQHLTFPPTNDTNSDAEWAVIPKHVMGYAGPFTVDWVDPPRYDDTGYGRTRTGHITHGPTTFAIMPSWWNVRFERYFTLYQDLGLLKLQTQPDDAPEKIVLFWKRIS
jgi:hypothetical protein